MNRVSYSIVANAEGGDTITVFIDGQVLIASNEHPNYERIVNQARSQEPEGLAELFDVSTGLTRRFHEVSERVSVAHGQVYLDHEPLDNALTRAILRFYEEGEDFRPLVAFLEKVQSNPSAHSREQLYSWLRAHDFTIADDGDILAYKGVSRDEDGVLRSVWHGTAIVNGETVRGRIPNEVGSVVTMPRGEVAFDPEVGCSTGLHVSTYDFARGYGDVMLRVKVNPRDVVSVPTDADAEKVRVCRYEVLEIQEEDRSDQLLYVSLSSAEQTHLDSYLRPGSEYDLAQHLRWGHHGSIEGQDDVVTHRLEHEGRARHQKEEAERVLAWEEAEAYEFEEDYCPTCDGEGEVWDFEAGEHVTCPDCEGEGVIER